MPLPFESMQQEERLAIVDLLIAHLAGACADAAATGHTSLYAEISNAANALKACREQISTSDTACAPPAVSAALRLLSRLQSRSPATRTSCRPGLC